MEEGKDCLVETACRMVALWLFHEEFLGLVATFIILGALLYVGHRRKKVRHAKNHRLVQQAHTSGVSRVRGDSHSNGRRVA